MGTATSRTCAVGLAALVLGLAGCGGSSGTAVRSSSAFAWLRAGAPPSGWHVAAIPLGATLPYPPGWVRLRGDAGTATAALFDRKRHFLGYLNLTPRQSNESLTNWGHFRVAHNAEENDRNIRLLAVGTGLRFRDGHGSCVRDSYSTTVGTSYIELACLIAGAHRSVVVVGASPPASWARTAPTLERAISAVSA